MTTLLEVKGLQVSYGHIAAVKGIDFALKAGEITSLVGANGAGKSTTLLALSGLIPRSQGDVRGQILFEGEDVTQWSPHKRVQRGIVQVAEGRATLTTMTVRENLELGAYTRKDRGQIVSDLERVFHLFPRLKERIDGMAGNLSGGEQQMLAMSRAYLTRPRIVLVDEASFGLAPLVVDKIYEAMSRLAERGMSLIIVEQYVQRALERADTVYILSRGEIVHSGSAKAIAPDEIYEKYLGIE